MAAANKNGEEPGLGGVQGEGLGLFGRGERAFGFQGSGGGSRMKVHCHTGSNETRLATTVGVNYACKCRWRRATMRICGHSMIG